MSAYDLDIDELISKLCGEGDERGRIDPTLLPENYDMETAVTSAYLQLKEETVKENNEKVPLLTTVSTSSLCNALMQMVMMGLWPHKKQCYFIPRWAEGGLKELHMQIGKFGYRSLMMRTGRVRDLNANVVFRNDDFQYEGDGFSWTIVRHHQQLINREPAPELEIDDKDYKAHAARSIRDRAVGGYATIKWMNGDSVTSIMGWWQIAKAWAHGQPKNRAINPGQVEQCLTDHQRDDPISAIERTLLNNLTKPYIMSMPLARNLSIGPDGTVAENRVNDPDTDAVTGEPVPPRPTPTGESQQTSGQQAGPSQGEAPEPQPTPSGDDADAGGKDGGGQERGPSFA